MINAILIAIIIVLLLGAWFASVPDGYEDEDGFHLGEK